MQDFNTVEKLQNATVYDSDGDKIGNVGQVYLDDQTNQPTFITVKTGFFGSNESFIPVAQATPSKDEDGLQVPFSKDFVKDAPNVNADGSLNPEEERRIYEYYSIDYPAAGQTVVNDTAAAGTAATVNTENTRDADDRDSMVVRDEQLNVGTEVRDTGQVRLRKHSYTDTETVEVPVSREEVVIEREPVDPNSAEARRGSDEEIVVNTREEVPVVDKTVTAERVSLDKNRVEGTERVTDTVEHEDVEVEREGGNKRRR